MNVTTAGFAFVIAIGCRSVAAASSTGAPVGRSTGAGMPTTRGPGVAPRVCDIVGLLATNMLPPSTVQYSRMNWSAGIGLGDVKLALALGPWLAWLGWPVLLAGAYVGFVLSGLGALALLALGRAGPGTALPHGPSMIVGAWLGWCAAPLL